VLLNKEADICLSPIVSYTKLHCPEMAIIISQLLPVLYWQQNVTYLLYQKNNMVQHIVKVKIAWYKI